jgi:RNA polymerase sigma-70 factor, ECF subfamily
MRAITFGKAEADMSSETNASEFTELYRAHQKMVRSVLFQVAGESSLDDLVQEAFVRIWRNYPKFRGDSKLSSWIYRICVNVALDHKRSVSRKKETSENDFARFEDGTRSQAQTLNDRDLVQKGLDTLSEEHRTVLVLALMQELSLAEIADVLEVAEGTVKSRLHYAKIEFRKFLSQKGVDL